MAKKINWDTDLTSEQRFLYINNALDYCRHLGIKIHVIKAGDSYIDAYGEEHIMELYSKECNLITKEIYLAEGEVNTDNQIHLFDILHELGHLQTNNIDMTTYEKEYRATQYAIDIFNFLNLEIKYGVKLVYSDYPEKYKIDPDEEWKLVW